MRKIIDLLRARGAWYLKTQPPNRPGVPDLLVCYKGRFLGIEVKNEEGVTSQVQRYELGKVGDAGGFALVARDPETVARVLDQIDTLVAINSNHFTDRQLA